SIVARPKRSRSAAVSVRTSRCIVHWPGIFLKSEQSQQGTPKRLVLTYTAALRLRFGRTLKIARGVAPNLVAFPRRLAKGHRSMIALIDHGSGNVRSVYNALKSLGAEVRLTGDVAEIASAERVVLPGVGAFGDCVRGIQERGLWEAVQGCLES